jgi:hypothetical protein
MANSFNNTTVNNTPNITTFYSHTVKYIINHIPDNEATARGAKFPATVICIIVVLQCHVIFSE